MNCLVGNTVTGCLRRAILAKTTGLKGSTPLSLFKKFLLLNLVMVASAALRYNSGWGNKLKDYAVNAKQFCCRLLVSPISHYQTPESLSCSE
jgi:hypothetical protein